MLGEKTMQTVMIVDDDKEILRILSRALDREGYATRVAGSADEALNLLERGRPDLMILDIMLPGMDGVDLCRTLRGNSRFADLPVLFLSALGHPEQIARGLDAGGDDYVVKPFALAELHARIRTALRRGKAAGGSAGNGVGGLILDQKLFRAVRGDRAVQLTSTEFRLLEYLIDHLGQVVSAEELLRAVWDYPPGTGDRNLVRAHVSNLRGKLASVNGGTPVVKTVFGHGYVVAEEPPDDNLN